MSIFGFSLFSMGGINFGNKKSKVPCDENISGTIRDFMCMHQGEFVQYAFLASEYHREFKEEYNEKTPNQEKIGLAKDKLLSHLNENFASAVQDSFEHMQKYFNGRHIKSPRICLKANYDPKNEKKIITLFREKHKSVGYNSDCAVGENTGFLSVKENGRYYICQDICADAQKGNYKNPRLLKNAVDIYIEPGWLGKKKSIKSNGFFKDDAWQNCWAPNFSEGVSVTPDYRDCYKSTLIIPLTLRNNSLKKTFIEAFNMEDVDRTIFGYLCFDHIEKNYFDRMLDVDFGYIFADILSLYLIARFTYTIRSRTFKGFVPQSGI